MNQNPMQRITLTLAALVLIAPNTGRAQEKKATAAANKPIAMGYILQADAEIKDKAKMIAKLKSSNRDWIVLDRVFTDEKPWTKKDLDEIRKGKPGRKVIAYLSIGEAEDYRHYWQESWTQSPPKFILGENPDWEGNYTVKFWAAEWQNIILEDVRRIMKQGFDGLYLDKVDVFELFEYDQKKDDWIDNHPNPDTKRSYREDTVEWVRQVGAEMRKVNKKALLIPQNASQLLEKPAYVKMISAIGVEDIFTNGEEKQADEDREYLLAFLKRASKAKKPVLCIEYCETKPLRTFATQQATKLGFNLLITDRHLKTLGSVPGTSAK